MGEDPTHSISSDDPSYWALWELQQGNTAASAELLLSGEPLHPLLLAELGDLLLGDHETHELRLQRKKLGAPKKKANHRRERELLEFYEQCERDYPNEQKKALIGRTADKFYPDEKSPDRKVYDALERARSRRENMKRMFATHLSRGT